MENMDNKNSVVIYGDYCEALNSFTQVQLGELFSAILSYAKYRKTPCIEDAEVRGCFRMIQHQIDFDTKRYYEKCEQNRINANKRYKKEKHKSDFDYANECDGIQSNA